MDIDFIKWMCEKAEGFDLSYIDNGKPTVWFSRKKYVFSQRATIIENTIIYPLLLQRAIEGVNREHKGASGIIQSKDGLIVGINYDETEEYTELLFEYHDSLETTKESALKYIYEQEMKK